MTKTSSFMSKIYRSWRKSTIQLGGHVPFTPHTFDLMTLKMDPFSSDAFIHTQAFGYDLIINLNSKRLIIATFKFLKNL